MYLIFLFQIRFGNKKEGFEGFYAKLILTKRYIVSDKFHLIDLKL